MPTRSHAWPRRPYALSHADYARTLDHAARLARPLRNRPRLLRRPQQRGDFDAPLRELKTPTCTFDCVMDHGAYFDVKRHRIMTQTPQPLGIHLGYAVPQAFLDAGLADRYRHAMEAAAAVYRTAGRAVSARMPPTLTPTMPSIGACSLTLNLRESFHFTQLRGGPNGHFAYRRIAMKGAQTRSRARSIRPLRRLCAATNIPMQTAIEQEFFAQV